MLLMGFNGLFAAVELRARELADHLAIPVPQDWRKIDHISDALHMSAALQSPAVRAVLEEAFLVRRVQCVAEVFAMCAQLACFARPTAGTAPMPDDNALLKPVRSTISGRIDQVNSVLELQSSARGAARYAALDKWTSQLACLHLALANKMA